MFNFFLKIYWLTQRYIITIEYISSIKYILSYIVYLYEKINF